MIATVVFLHISVFSNNPLSEQKVSTGNFGPDLKRFEIGISVALARNTPNVKKGCATLLSKSKIIHFLMHSLNVLTLKEYRIVVITSMTSAQ